MIRPERVVTQTRKEATNRLPDSLTEGATLVEYLEAHGCLQQIAERLRVRREGGYVGLDIVLFLILLFASGRRASIKDFGEVSRGHRRALAALAARRMLPSPPSVSRFLASVEDDALAEFGPWLLLEGAKATDCLRHPSVMTRDCVGESWHVFDLDPTVTVLRQRALPESDDLPEPRRRAHEAKAGYTGRKRGDVQLSRTTLQHAGSALWLGIWTQPGNGDWRGSSAAAVQTVVRTCAVLGHSTDRALIRVDGAGGNTPFIAACQAAQVSYVARSAHYKLLGDPAIRALLNAADWNPVQDSKSGPSRQATELGSHTLPSESFQEDGTRFAPVRSRIVVSRFRATEARGSGWLHEDWHYELFVTDVSADAFPAPEVVSCYYQRTGIENRFRQEDQELGLDRIFSYHVPGQNLANLVGLLIWNLRVRQGFALAQESLPQIRAQAPRVARVVPERVTLSGAEERSDEDPPAPQEMPSPVEQRPSGSGGEVLAAELNQLDWSKLTARHAGWAWNSEASALTCPTGKTAKLTTVNVQSSAGTGNLRFSTKASDCRACPVRGSCTSSDAPEFRKEKAIPIPISQAQRIAKAANVHEAIGSTRSSKPSSTPVLAPSWTPPAISTGLAILTAAYAVLLPAALRRLFAAACRNIEVRVEVVLSPDDKPSSFYAPTDAKRQQRRLTWSDNIQRNAIAPGTTVTIQMATADPVAERLFALGRAEVSRATSGIH